MAKNINFKNLKIYKSNSNFGKFVPIHTEQRIGSTYIEYVIYNGINAYDIVMLDNFLLYGCNELGNRFKQDKKCCNYMSAHEKD